MVKRYADLYLDARKALLPTEGQSAAQVARELLSKISGKSAAEILADRELYASDEIGEQLDECVRRVADGEPLPYILEEWDFCGMTLRVTRDTLIPRDDTVAVTDLAIKKTMFLEQNPRILDLCTGTGCIGLAIAKRVKDARVTLADVSVPALNIARQNAAAMHFGPRVNCVQADALQQAPAFLRNYNLLVSNPPYVTDAEMEALPPSVRRFEPELALRGGPDGLTFYRAIVQNYTRVLAEEGYLCLEFGMGQETAVSQILTDGGYEILSYQKDNQDITRAVIARKKREG
ncbi:MAG: peptide chain release factor N(5)-glutamine methyltransferase [Oscillospiraceae bacterium]|nr:peptide chain release factor N(5)-glutamine methyltransferase [Oscillospiraceae bacterium]